MKKIIFIIIIFLALLFPIVPLYASSEVYASPETYVDSRKYASVETYANSETYENTKETLDEQKEEFGIQEFIANAKQFAGEAFENISIDELLNDAIKGKVDNSTIFKRIVHLFRKRNDNGNKGNY